MPVAKLLAAARAAQARAAVEGLALASTVCRSACVHTLLTNRCKSVDCVALQLRAELDACWKDMLLYQFHDVLPGSAIQRVYDVTKQR